MNKIRFFLFAAVLLFAGTVSAQKTGYIKLDEVVMLMPETARVDTLLSRFEADSLQPRLQYTLAEYRRKDSIVNGKDSLRTPAAARNKMREEMQQDLYELQNWQAIVQNSLQAKQSELVEPIYRKAYNAVQQVAKDNGYTYVYNRDALIVAPPADDLMPLVAKKLNIKLPPATAGAGTGTAPRK